MIEASSEPTYGSAYHFRRYREHGSETLDLHILNAIGTPSLRLTWLYPLPQETRPEFTGVSFLPSDADETKAWEQFWPPGVSSQSWDGVARLDGGPQVEWILFETKTNHPEFCSSPCNSRSEKNRKLIVERLDQTKKLLGVHRYFHWEGTYYQYANRLAFLNFLQSVGVGAHLVLIYFYGDRFPDGTACPESEEPWNELIRACHLTLGLRDDHSFANKVHNVFLPVLP
jgi:hypothetical protein